MTMLAPPSQGGSAAAIDRDRIEAVVRAVLAGRLGAEALAGLTNGTLPNVAPPTPTKPNLVVNISARHCHLTQKTVDRLFGPGYQLTKMRSLYQDTDFAANETVALVGPRRRVIADLRILGPCRDFDQVELALTDAISLGVEIPVRLSGDIEGTPGILLVGPNGSVELEKGVIRAERHVHMNPDHARYYGVKPLDRMNLRVHGRCPTTLEGVLVRVNPAWKLEVHIDTDEANASDLTRADKVELVKP